VTLRTASGYGEDVRVRAAYVEVAPPPAEQVFRAVADARVNQANPGSNYGSDAVLRVRNDATGSYQTFLRFDLSTLSGPAQSVKLRLACTDGSNAGGSIHAVANDAWGEGTITWANRPAFAALPLATLGSVEAGFWVEIELGPGAIEQGLVSLAVAGGSSNSAYYSSRETASAPELVVLVGERAGPLAVRSDPPRELR
jgi:hypothetical protein